MCTGLQAKLSEEQIKNELCPYLHSIVPRKRADWLPNSFHLKAIFNAMTDQELWCYLNYFPLESLVQTFGDDNMLTKIEHYKKDRSSFLIATKIKHYIPIAKRALLEEPEPVESSPVKRDTKYYWKLQTKLDQSVSDYSLDYLENLWKSLASVLFLPLSYVLDTIVEESIIVTWLIPAELGPKVIQIAQQSTKVFMMYQPLLRLTVGDECVYEKVK